jgi:hypothetical protein
MRTNLPNLVISSGLHPSAEEDEESHLTQNTLGINLVQRIIQE